MDHHDDPAGSLSAERPRPQVVSLDPIDLDLELVVYSQFISDAPTPMRPQAAFDHKANQQIPSLDDWPIWRVPVEQSMEIEVIACIFNTLACDTELKIRSLFCTPTCPGNVFFEARGIEDALAAVKDVPHTWVDAKSNSSLYICLSARSTDCLRYLKYGANENSMALPGRLVRVRPESRPPNSLAYISSSRNAGAIIELELLPSSFEDGAAVGIENAPIEVGIDEVQLTHVIPTADEIPPTSQNLLNAEKARFLHRIRLLRGERVIVIEGPQRGLTGTVFDITGTTIGLVRTYPVAEVHSAVPEGGIVYTQIWTIQRHFQVQDPVDIAETELNSRSVATATFIEYANGDRVKLQQSSKANGAQHFEEFVELDDRIRHHIPHEPPPPILPCMGTGDPYRHMEVAIVDHPVLKGRQGRIVGSHLSISNHWVYEVNIGQEMTPWRSQLEAKYMRELHSGLHIQKAVRLPHEVLLPPKPVEPLQPNDHAKIPHQAIEDNDSVQRAEPALVPVVASTPLPPLIPQYIEADEASDRWLLIPQLFSRPLKVLINGKGKYRHGNYDHRIAFIEVDRKLESKNKCLRASYGDMVKSVRIRVRFLRPYQDSFNAGTWVVVISHEWAGNWAFLGGVGQICVRQPELPTRFHQVVFRLPGSWPMYSCFDTKALCEQGIV